MSARIGLIGVGLMGHAIAKNLLKHGFSLTLLHHSGNQPTEDLVAGGARVVGSPAEVGAVTDVVVLVVTGAPEVEAVLIGDQGLLSALRPGATVIDCSTSKPEVTQRLAAMVEQVGSHMIDAPMTGIVKQAREGTLNVLVGGDPTVLEAVRPVLEAFTRRISHVGPIGTGHRMKLLHNFVSIGGMALIAEAAAHAIRAGVDPAVFVEVLATGGGSGAALDRLRTAILGGDATGVPFSIANAAKDLRYYQAVAAGTGARSAIADAVASTLDAQVSSGSGHRYVSELVRLFQSSSDDAREVSRV
jgi:3-hydroxyisobutyrate dehydrogenase